MSLISQDSAQITEYTEMKVAYGKQMTGPSLVHETGHSKPVCWDDPEGWDREGGGSGVRDERHMYTHG